MFNKYVFLILHKKYDIFAGKNKNLVLNLCQLSESKVNSKTISK